MLTRLLVFLCGASPALRRILWRWWYGKLAREIAAGSWTFMNYGFLPPKERGEPLPLKPEDEPDRLCIQLYERVAAAVPLEGTDILEVGSGRGGGSSYLARYHKPKRVTGVDYSPDAVAFSKQRHASVPNLNFAVGDAEKLPFPDASFDVVVNVESSHCYGDVARFFSEVARVLKPGGHFVYADLRGASEMAELKAILAREERWEAISEENITAGVAAALQADDVRKRKMISELVAPKLQPIFQEFAGVGGGQVFGGLQQRNLLYFRFAFRRK